MEAHLNSTGGAQNSGSPSVLVCSSSDPAAVCHAMGAKPRRPGVERVAVFLVDPAAFTMQSGTESEYDQLRGLLEPIAATERDFPDAPVIVVQTTRPRADNQRGCEPCGALMLLSFLRRHSDVDIHAASPGAAVAFTKSLVAQRSCVQTLMWHSVMFPQVHQVDLAPAPVTDPGREQSRLRALSSSSAAPRSVPSLPSHMPTLHSTRSSGAEEISERVRLCGFAQQPV